MALEHLSADALRENWYRNISSDTPDHVFALAFEMCWQSWLKKFNYEKSKYEANKFVFMELQAFMCDREATTIILEGRSSKQRKRIHIICDNLGLLHDSQGTGNRRKLVIRKPDQYAWEFSGPGPRRKRTPRYKCDECGNRDEELMISVHFPDVICCETCLPDMIDADGNPWDCHKWEPLSCVL